MELFTPQTKDTKKQKLFILLGGVLTFIALVGVMLILQSQKGPAPSTGPSDIRRVGAVTGNTITLSIRSDANGPYIEHNGQKVSATNIIGPLQVGTEYSLTVQNVEDKKRSIFIPSKDIVIGFINTGSDTRPIRFDKPGTYEFLPGVYEPGWQNMKGAFVVIGPPTATPASTVAPPTITTTPTSTSNNCDAVTSLWSVSSAVPTYSADGLRISFRLLGAFPNIMNCLSASSWSTFPSAVNFEDATGGRTAGRSWSRLDGPYQITDMSESYIVLPQVYLSSFQGPQDALPYKLTVKYCMGTNNTNGVCPSNWGLLQTNVIFTPPADTPTRTPTPTITSTPT